MQNPVIKASYQQNGGKSIIILAHDSETAQRLSAFCTELGKKIQTTNTNAQTLAKLKQGMVFSATSINEVWRTWRRQIVRTAYHQKLDSLKIASGNNIRNRWKNSKHSYLSFVRSLIKQAKAEFNNQFIKDYDLITAVPRVKERQPKKHITNYREDQVFTYRLISR